jgi:hypothetical protein
MSSSASPSVPCPACGEAGTGRFCSSCGAPRAAAACAGCGAALSAGARFCHRCGLAAGAPAPAGGFAADALPAGAALRTANGAPVAAGRGAASAMPWAAAFVALLALAAMAAGRNFGVAKGSRLDAPLNALPQEQLGELGGPPAGAGGGGPVGPFAGAAGSGGATGRPPDLSKMTPREMADRLFDRVMRLAGEGKADSAQMFSQMALQQYASMPLDLDLRYDMGRVAEVGGQPEIAAAQADTILREAPTHLLGLVLATKAAALQGRQAEMRAFQRRLVAAAPAEQAKPREEYERHANDITAALRVAASPPTAPGATPPATP